jgi:hypothetical protein
MDISKVIGLEGGNDATWFKVLAEQERGKSKYYPAIVDGIERGWSEFKSLDEYLAAKVERERETICLTVAGNPVVAEEAISRVLGRKALSTSPITVDVYPDEPLVDMASGASAMGKSKSEKKTEAARINGQRGGRPRNK